MPITPYLDGRRFDPGTERVTGDSNPSDHVAAIVARRILALAKNGQSNADHLCDQALASLGVHEYYAATGDGTFRLRRLRP